VERTRLGKGKKPVERVRMDCLTQTQSVGRPRGSPGVVGTSVAAAAAVVVGVTAVAVADVTIPLVVEQVESEPVVVLATLAVPATLVVDAPSHSVVEPIGPAWPVAEPVAAKG